MADVSTSKTGKHGHAKCAFVAIDIFTGKKMEDLSPSSHNVDVPHVSRLDYTLLDITDDGFVSALPAACCSCWQLLADPHLHFLPLPHPPSTTPTSPTPPHPPPAPPPHPARRCP